MLRNILAQAEVYSLFTRLVGATRGRQLFDTFKPIVTTGILRIPYTHLVLECHRETGNEVSTANPSVVAAGRGLAGSGADSVEKVAP